MLDCVELEKWKVETGVGTTTTGNEVEVEDAVYVIELTVIIA